MGLIGRVEIFRGYPGGNFRPFCFGTIIWKLGIIPVGDGLSPISG